MKNKEWMKVLTLLLMFSCIVNCSSLVLASDGFTDPVNDVRYFPTNSFGPFWNLDPENASKVADSITNKWRTGTLTSTMDAIDIRQVSIEGDGNLSLTVEFDGDINERDLIFIVIWANVSGNAFYGVLLLNTSKKIDATYHFRNDANQTSKGSLTFGDTQISARFPAKWWGNESESKTMNILSGTITDENALYLDIFPNDLVGEGGSSDEGLTSWISWISNNWVFLSIFIMAFLIFIIWLMMKQNRKIRNEVRADQRAPF